MTIYTLVLFLSDGEPIIIDRIGEFLFDNGVVKFWLLTESGVLDSKCCYLFPASNFYFMVKHLEGFNV